MTITPSLMQPNVFMSDNKMNSNQLFNQMILVIKIEWGVKILFFKKIHIFTCPTLHVWTNMRM